MIIQAIRSMIFYALFIGYTAVLAVPFGIYSLFGPKMTGWWVVKAWYVGNLFLLRWVVGIKTQITGQENLPDGPFIIASKHMSDWDIFALLPATKGRPTFISKKELLDIPFFGWCMQNFHTIRIDRKNGGAALPQMITQGKEAIARDCRVVIYPEGTRRPPLDEPKYKWGLAKMYEALDVPVVPVALTSGLYWPRNSLILWPGTARAKYLKPIPSGLDLDTFHETIQERIEPETTKMLMEDIDKGIARPINKALQARIDAHRR
ncbi:lysophospholipid acyltransferase family protein [uncultured Maritalea sp.]|jgi:1-acyl-sn-glycerol-3-phosphate acyltransferase|uniref:lysophospholipid acyltransferase family protein n=1 Tax=uncultured Maritalea sp. TaxID=757249 RepID=UPI00262E2F77|nr:lysophospholipid acyltransferase family protein [uncultured Maritalea sp.]